MTSIKIRQPKRIVRQTTTGGLVLVKRQLGIYTPFKKVLGQVFQKRFGLPILALWLMMICRALLGGSSFKQFGDDWNKDSSKGIIAEYRKKITHRLLARNIHRIAPQFSRKVVIETVKTLFKKGLITAKRVAIDSTPIVVSGKKYPKTGLIKRKGKFYTGFKLSIAFDIDSKVPLAYIITPLNVHDSQLLISLIKMVQSEYDNSLKVVLLDRGYYGAKFFQFLDSEKLFFFIPAKKYDRMTKKIQTLKFSDFRKQKSSKYYYKDDKFWIRKYGPIRCIFIAYKEFEEWMPEEEKNKHIWALFTNHYEITPKNAIRAYKDRWQIEIFFKQCKNELGLNILPGRDYRIIQMHISSILLSYVILVTFVLEEKLKNEELSISIKKWKNRFINLVLSIVLQGNMIYYEFQEKWVVLSKTLERDLNGGIFM